MPLLIDSESRVASLTRAVDHILCESGPTALTLRRIAATSGVSTSSMLHHFGSRERMLMLCAVCSTRARTAALTDEVIADGPLGLLPRHDADLLGTRAWLAWLELWRCLPVLEQPVSAARGAEQALLHRASDLTLDPAELPGIQALLDGLRVAVCAPVRPMSREQARACLAQRLGVTTELHRPVVDRGAWAWPYVPGPRAVAGAGRGAAPPP